MNETFYLTFIDLKKSGDLWETQQIDLQVMSEPEYEHNEWETERNEDMERVKQRSPRSPYLLSMLI